METKSSNRSFGVVFFIFFLLIAIWPMFKGGEIRIWSILLSLFFDFWNFKFKSFNSLKLFLDKVR